MRVIDLTLPIRKHWRWPLEQAIVKSFDWGDQNQITAFSLKSHWYTHTDSPRHEDKSGKTLDDYSIDSFVGRAVILDLSYVGASEPITAEMLDRALAGKPRTDILIVRTDWAKKTDWEDVGYWDNAPYITVDGAKWLHAQKPKLVGFDFPQDYEIRLMRHDPNRFLAMPVHEHVLRNGILMVEYLTNLWEIGQDTCQIVALPLKLEKADGSPTRVIAIVEGVNNQ